MEINRSYKVKLNDLEQQALESITNQKGVMDNAVFIDLIRFVDMKLTEAFYAGFTEYHVMKKENICG